MSDKNIAMKEKAIELLKQMDIYAPYIKGFRESDKVCFFEGFGGFWIDQEPELHKKMKAIEEKHKCKVYAVTHEYTEFGELYDFLIVTDYPEEWDTLVYTEGSRHTAFAYVWNKDDTGAVSSAALPYRVSAAVSEGSREVSMKYTNEVQAILTAIFAINRTSGHEDKDITLVLDYAFRLRFQKAFRREYKPAYPLLHR